jgi:hypothetical protein
MCPDFCVVPLGPITKDPTSKFKFKISRWSASTATTLKRLHEKSASSREVVGNANGLFCFGVSGVGPPHVCESDQVGKYDGMDRIDVSK